MCGHYIIVSIGLESIHNNIISNTTKINILLFKKKNGKLHVNSSLLTADVSGLQLSEIQKRPYKTKQTFVHNIIFLAFDFEEMIQVEISPGLIWTPP